jgi:hypothetical protein
MTIWVEIFYDMLPGIKAIILYNMLQKIEGGWCFALKERVSSRKE